jgi:hypothetical protein
MRKIGEMQLKIGQVPISDIEMGLHSRDEIPPLLLGLQAIDSNRKFDDIVKNPIYCVAAVFCSFGILYVWPLSQKTTTPCDLNFSIWNFYDAV